MAFKIGTNNSDIQGLVWSAVKSDLPWFADLDRLATRVIGSGEVWTAPISYEIVKAKLKPVEVLEMPHSTIEIFELCRVGTEIPDISTYWAAFMDGKFFSRGYRPSVWNSDRHCYQDWRNAVVEKARSFQVA